jgi:beta-lactamase class A
LLETGRRERLDRRDAPRLEKPSRVAPGGQRAAFAEPLRDRGDFLFEIRRFPPVRGNDKVRKRVRREHRLDLARVDRAALGLDQPIAYGEADLLAYAPVTAARVTEGRMTIEELARAAVVVSDNTAANLLLAQIGGPPGLTRFFRDVGDDVTRLDRNEPTLNTNTPGDERDTTTPRAMALALRAVLTGDVLSPASRERLTRWLVECQTGLSRLRAGLPASWKVGDKTGTGENGACNDVAIAWPPAGGPWVMAAYMSDSSAPAAELNAAHAEIGRIVAARGASGQARVT